MHGFLFVLKCSILLSASHCEVQLPAYVDLGGCAPSLSSIIKQSILLSFIQDCLSLT